MASIFGLDIPSGLEDLYNELLSLFNNSGAVSVKKITPTRFPVARSKIAARSLFLIYQDTYNGLSDARKIAWTSYWSALPFGSHSGAQGWPGSGFSGFVYANAPRYRLGLSPLLDPPGGYGPELCTNADFELNADGWSLDGAYWDAGALWVDGIGDAYIADISQNFGLTLENGSYHVEIECSIPAGVVGEGASSHFPGPHVLFGGLAVDDGGTPYIGTTADENGNIPTTYTFDGLYSNDPTTNGFAIHVEASFDYGRIGIQRVSLKKILT